VATDSFPVAIDAAAACFKDFHLAVDAQHLGHLLREVGIALFQAVSSFVRLQLLLIQDSCTPCPSRSMLASVAGEEPGRPRLVRIAEVLRLPARQRHQLRFGLQGDRTRGQSTAFQCGVS
jgi:hypothetical protein